ncbi:hypothetical protein C440_09863 [Haloferax mucosum ATCC BAA-1512]|uniref:Uncharacterized protein n=1 Tax=Haloferax mucosum ATCC BAA-1512 TaxID=662479 RepID=M0ICG5_9EURY|nr:HTH domain-containing protein [Haloferax mucosum]ELZ94475.1 hypothetical protein C440_09863 [Haloferax mucosum ATCC BAA-1512]
MDDSKRVKLFLRADAEIGAECTKEAAVEKLTELVDAGRIDDYDVYVWGSDLRVDGPLANTAYGTELLEHIREFKQWATTNDVALEAAFTERRIVSSIADEHYDVVSLPTLCLGVYDDGELIGVYPCNDGEWACSVVEYLERLDDGRRSKVPEPITQTHG